MLPARPFSAAASFGLVVKFAEFVEIVGYRHRERFLGRESKTVSPASGGIITKGPRLSTESREFTRKNLQFQNQLVSVIKPRDNQNQNESRRNNHHVRSEGKATN